MVASESEFKGHPTLNLKDEEAEGYPTSITFGVSKARLILEHISDIEEFVKKHTDIESNGGE